MNNERKAKKIKRRINYEIIEVPVEFLAGCDVLKINRKENY